MIFQVPANTAYYQTVIDLSQTKGYDVDVTATIDERTGIATWIFTTIDPTTGAIPLDPTIGFLVPDDAGGSSKEGCLVHHHALNQADPTGTVIDARATVTFDTEPPINTPQIFNTIDAGTNPRPARSSASSRRYETSGQFDVLGRNRRRQCLGDPFLHDLCSRITVGRSPLADGHDADLRSLHRSGWP